MPASSHKVIKMGGKEYEFCRPKLKKWLELEDIRDDINKALKNWDSDEIARQSCLYVSTALSSGDVQDIAWYDVAIAISAIGSVCSLGYDFPFLRVELKDKKEAWDYCGRTWYIWLYMLAKEFGWTSEYIAELDVDDALALAQEIAVNEQIEKEFQWAISEVPYQSKDGFKPLDRPKWMLYNTSVSPIRKTKIRKEFLPVGAIVKHDTKYNEPEESDTTL